MSSDLDRSLRTTHRSVLVAIAMCAVVSAIQPGVAEEAAPDPTITTVAVALAVGTIATRRAATSPRVTPRTRLILVLCAYGIAVALAVLGSYIAIAAGQKQTGLVFALAAGIFCLRPLPRLSAD
jgi:hypothetical protein